MGKAVRYSKTEQAIITQCVVNNPTNISEAMSVAKKRIQDELNINRSVNGLAHQYYTVIKKNKTVFTVKSKAVKVSNVKNTPVQGKILTNKLDIINSLVMLLSPEEKQQLMITTFKAL